MSATPTDANARGPDRRSSVVAGAVPDAETAERGVRALQSAGFGRDTLGLALHRRSEPGGLLGGVVGSLVGVEAETLVDAGPVVVGGMIAAVLRAGGTTGRAGGRIADVLETLDLPETDVEHFAERFSAGDALVTVRAGGRMREAVVLLTENGADVGSRAELAAAESYGGTSNHDRRDATRPGRRRTDRM